MIALLECLRNSCHIYFKNQSKTFSLFYQDTKVNQLFRFCNALLPYMKLAFFFSVTIRYTTDLLTWQLFIMLCNWFKHCIHFTAICNRAIQSRKLKCSVSWQKQWFWTGRWFSSVFHDIGMNFKINEEKARLKYAVCKVNTVERSMKITTNEITHH